ncbi:MAG: hypothetical protein JSW67_12255 [Candidatus Latescibacterota bacterium]|nr:MAG: hypothetical protein JSW67_12255 [Candidatus Latescibacterota bacterium]
MQRRRTLLHICILVGALAMGCASATKRLEQGAELESQGRYEEAAQRYIQALRKDPGLVDARERLTQLGPVLLESYVEQASGFSATGFPIRAADAFRTGDALVRSAAGVRVPLALPAGYAEGRRRTFDDAIVHLMRVGRSAEAEQRYADAIAAYNAVDTYEPQARQRTEAGEARVRTWIAWGEADLAAGHFRAAYHHAEEALALLGNAKHPAAARALSLRDAAIERGTIYVAVAPVWRSDEAARKLSREFIAALNDELELNHWNQPPLFVAVIDPLVVRRELRRQGYSRTLLTRREAVRVGRGVGADYVVSGKILQVVTDEVDVKQEKRTARTTTGQDTTYVVRKGKRTVHLTTTYRVIDVQHSRATQERTVEIDETGRFERGEYNGNPRELVLSRNERRLFDHRRARDEVHEIEERLLEKTTVSLAQSVFEDLLNSVN